MMKWIRSSSNFSSPVSVPTNRFRLGLEPLDERVMPDATPINPPPTNPPASQSSSSATNTSQAAYTQYLATTSQAYTAYNSLVSTARSSLNAGVANANSSLATALNSAMATANASIAQLKAAADTSTNQALATFITAYDAAYNTFSAAWDAAGTNVVALQQAVDGFNATVGVAYNQLTTKVNAALATAQAGTALVQSALDTAVATADQAWDNATNSALAIYNNTERVAWANYVAAEQSAWNVYLAAIPGPALSAAQVSAPIAADPTNPQPIPLPVLQPRQQNPKAPPVGPVVKVVPLPFKITPKQDGTGWKIVVPVFKAKIKWLPFQPTIIGDFNGVYTPLPKPGKPVFGGSITLGIFIDY